MVKRREPKGAMEMAYEMSVRAEQQLFGEEKEMTTTTKATEVIFHNQGELAVVRVLPTGRIEVERDGKSTKFQPHHTIEDVTDRFTQSGWERLEEEEDGTPAEVQQAVDLYLELHEKMSALKDQMESLKSKVVKPYMVNNKVSAIKGTQGKQVYLQPVTATNSTSLYSNYDPAEVLPLLDGQFYNDIMEARINSDKLESLLKLEKVSHKVAQKIKACKIVKAGTPQFRVKK